MNETTERFVAAQIERIADRRRTTDDLPRFAGKLKDRPEDFEVEEIPAYEPSGEGEHLYLWIRKRDAAANELVRHLERTLGVSRYEIGVAGMKDKHAVTRQWVSVPVRCERDVPNLDVGGYRVERVDRHTNRLKTGHLRGNRFIVVVRNVPPDAVERAGVIADRLRETGLANHFGTQRFGHAGETLRLGFELLTGEKRKKDLNPRDRRFLLRLALSAAQSTLFNESLERRLDAGTLRTLRAGDVCEPVGSRGRFLVEDVAVDQARFDRFEILPTGPMYGPRMMMAEGAPGEEDRALLEESGLTLDSFARHGKLAAGTRRPYLLPCGSLDIQPHHPNALKFQFELPSGAYATEVLGAFLLPEFDGTGV